MTSEGPGNPLAEALDDASTFELWGRSERSFSAATADAVRRAGLLFAARGWGDRRGRFEVLEMRGPVSDGKRTGFQIRIRCGLAAAPHSKETR